MDFDDWDDLVCDMYDDGGDEFSGMGRGYVLLIVLAIVVFLIAAFYFGLLGPL